MTDNPERAALVAERDRNTAEREREARKFDVVAADAILNLLDLREQANGMDPTRIVMFADHMADLMQELRAIHAAVRATTLGDAIKVVDGMPVAGRSYGFALRTVITRLRAMEGTLDED